MKQLLFTLCIAAMITACNNDETNKNNTAGHIDPALVNNPASASESDQKSSLPAFEFTETNFDFGTITSGASVTHEYRFRNSGDAELLIAEVKGSCGCTTPEYPKTPVAPGDEGVIKVTFNSTGMSGQVAKTITILANTIPSTKVLTISGEIIK